MLVIKVRNIFPIQQVCSTKHVYICVLSGMTQIYKIHTYSKILYTEFRPWLNASLVTGQVGDFDDFTNSTALSEQLILDKVHQHVSAYEEDHHHHPKTIDHFDSDYSEPKYYLGKYDCTVHNHRY